VTGWRGMGTEVATCLSISGPISPLGRGIPARIAVVFAERSRGDPPLRAAELHAIELFWFFTCFRPRVERKAG
jgi:hypothetical protein